MTIGDPGSELPVWPQSIGAYPNQLSGDWTPNWPELHAEQAAASLPTRNTSSGDYDLVHGQWVPRATQDQTSGAITTPPPYWQALDTMGIGVGPRGPNGTNPLPGDRPPGAVPGAAPGMAVRAAPAASLAGIAGGAAPAAAAAVDNETQRSIPQGRSLLDMLPANWRQILGGNR